MEPILQKEEKVWGHPKPDTNIKTIIHKGFYKNDEVRDENKPEIYFPPKKNERKQKKKPHWGNSYKIVLKENGQLKKKT